MSPRELDNTESLKGSGVARPGGRGPLQERPIHSREREKKFWEKDGGSAVQEGGKLHATGPAESQNSDVSIPECTSYVTSTPTGKR